MFEKIIYSLRKTLKKPFKIGMISPQYPQKGKSNEGAAIHVFYLSQELAKLGCEIHVFTMGNKNSIKEEYIGEGKRTVHTIQTKFDFHTNNFNVHKKFSRVMFDTKVVSEVLKEHSKENFDILHSHVTHTGAVMSKFFNDIKWIHTYHSLEKNRLKFMSTQERKYFKIAKWMEEVFDYADALIAVSKKMKEELIEEYAIKTSKIFQIPNGVDVELFKPMNTHPKKQVVYVGRPSLEKGIDIVVKIASIVLKRDSEIKFVIVSPSQTTLPKAIEPIIRRLEALEKTYPERLIWKREPLSREELARLYNESMIYIQPSRYESFGLSVLEAMACGNAVICSNRGGMPEVVNGAGKIIPLNSLVFAKEIIKLTKDYRLRERYGRKAIKRAQDFTWKGVGKEMLDLYKIVAKKQEAESEKTQEALKSLEEIKEKSKPKVSVLLAVYNEEKHIEEAIESVLKQTLENIELIVVDDISTDKTLEIAREYANKDPRVKVIQLKEKGYRAGALNEAIKLSRGHYISFLDGDDIYNRDKLEKQSKFLDENKNIDMIYSNMTRFNEEGDIDLIDALEFKRDAKKVLLEASKRKDLGEIKPAYLLYHSGQQKYIPGCSVLIRKKVFEKCSFDPLLKRSQDYDLWFQIIGKGFKIKKYPLTAYKYRVHAEMNSKNKDEMLKAASHINKKLKERTYFK